MAASKTARKVSERIGADNNLKVGERRDGGYCLLVSCSQNAHDFIRKAEKKKTMRNTGKMFLIQMFLNGWEHVSQRGTKGVLE